MQILHELILIPFHSFDMYAVRWQQEWKESEYKRNGIMFWVYTIYLTSVWSCCPRRIHLVYSHSAVYCRTNHVYPTWDQVDPIFSHFWCSLVPWLKQTGHVCNLRTHIFVHGTSNYIHIIYIQSILKHQLLLLHRTCTCIKYSWCAINALSLCFLLIYIGEWWHMYPESILFTEVEYPAGTASQCHETQENSTDFLKQMYSRSQDTSICKPNDELLSLVGYWKRLKISENMFLATVLRREVWGYLMWMIFWYTLVSWFLNLPCATLVVCGCFWCKPGFTENLVVRGSHRSDPLLLIIAPETKKNKQVKTKLLCVRSQYYEITETICLYIVAMRLVKHFHSHIVLDLLKAPRQMLPGFKLYTPEIRPWDMMVGRIIWFWDGNFSVAMLKLRAGGIHLLRVSVCLPTQPAFFVNVVFFWQEDLLHTMVCMPSKIHRKFLWSYLYSCLAIVFTNIVYCIVYVGILINQAVEQGFHRLGLCC